MKRFQKKYEQLRRSLTEAGGVREIIAKHLEKRNAKASDFQIIDNTLTFKQLTDEIRKSLQQRSSVEEKIAFLEQIAQANGGRL